VARLNYISGEISIQPGGVNDWVQGNINRPLTSSDRVWADKDARAELQLGGAALRVDSNTSLTLVNVSDNNPRPYGTVRGGELLITATPFNTYARTTSDAPRSHSSPTYNISNNTSATRPSSHSYSYSQPSRLMSHSQPTHMAPYSAPSHLAHYSQPRRGAAVHILRQ
jgi:hypothetical protein